MSGRVRVTLEDGRQVTGYRKTLRTRTRARSLPERLHDINERYRRKYPAPVGCDVRLGFQLPKWLAGFVSDGQHGIGVNVIKGFVQISGSSAEFCFQQADELFRVIATGGLAFRVMAVISASNQPGYWARYIIVNARTAVVSPASEPKLYGAQAA